MPFFSIIIPVYNVAPYLRECLDSVLAQTFKDWEAICVDDGSSDGSGAILNEYAATDSRFHIIHQPNAGVGVARNAALAVARGEYVTFIDADDSIANMWLATARQCLGNGTVDLLRMNLTYRKDGAPAPVIPDSYTTKLFSQRLDALVWGWDTLLRRGWSVVLFIRRINTPLEEGYGFVPGMRIREDNIFALGIFQWVNSCMQCDYAGYFYRQRNDSAVMKTYAKRDQDLFRTNLRRLWRMFYNDIKRTDSYNDLRNLYLSHMHMRMCPEWRFNPFRVWRALKRRLSI